MSQNTSPSSTTRNPKVQLPAEPYPALQMPLGYDEICRILPHRYPFLLVDRIVELEPGHRCVGIKCVTANEEFFQGHFPGRPVMPGVLILEAMAQVAGILTLVSRNTPGALSYFAAIEKARFRQPVQPGDQLVTEATLHVLRGALCKVSVVGRVDGQVMVEADYTFMTADNSSSSAITRAASVATTPNVAALNGTQPTSTPVAAAGTLAQRIEVTEPPRGEITQTYIHPSAMIDPKAKLEDPVWIGPYCVVEGDTQVGAGTILEFNVIVKRGTSIGQRCHIWPNVVLGHEPQDSKYKGEQSFVRIGDDNVLREMVTVHRATGEGKATVIGNENLLMAYAHIGHNCVIGNNNMLSNSTGIAGHVTIEDHCVIGGFVGIHQNVHIGSMAMVGGLSKVTQDIPPFCIFDGRPAKPHGLNTRGLRRNGVSAEHRKQVNAAYRLLFRTKRHTEKLNTTQAIERVRSTIPSNPTLEQLLNFIESAGEGRLGRQDETPHV